MHFPMTSKQQRLLRSPADQSTQSTLYTFPRTLLRKNTDLLLLPSQLQMACPHTPMQFWCPARPHLSQPARRFIAAGAGQAGKQHLQEPGPPGKHLILLGVTASCKCPRGNLIIGGGNGTQGIIVANPGLSKVNPAKALKPMIMLASTKVQGGVTSITVDKVGSKSWTFFVGTAACTSAQSHLRPCSCKVHPTQTSSFLSIVAAPYVTCTHGMVAVASLQSHSVTP
jgi:hypothetical protein